MVINSFSVCPKYSIFLLGRDILHKVEATIHPNGRQTGDWCPLRQGHKMIMLIAMEKHS